VGGRGDELTADEQQALMAASLSQRRGASFKQDAPAWLVNTENAQVLELAVRKIGGGLGLIPSEVPVKLLRASNQKAKLYVCSITKGSGAANSGLKLYDRLLELNGANLRNMGKLEANRTFGQVPEGAVVTMLVARDSTDAAAMEALSRPDRKSSDAQVESAASAGRVIPEAEVVVGPSAQLAGSTSADTEEYREQLTGLLWLQNRHLPKAFALILPPNSMDYRGRLRVTFQSPDDSVGVAIIDATSSTTAGDVISVAATNMSGLPKAVAVLLSASNAINECELIEINDQGKEVLLPPRSEWPLKRVVKKWEIHLIQAALEGEPTAEAGFVLRAKGGTALYNALSAEGERLAAAGSKKKKGNWFSKKDKKK
jgi:hypothetical protein